jgi:hypothetical protein
LQAVIERIVVTGPVARVEARLEDGQPIEASFAREALADQRPGDKLAMAINKAHVFGG